MMKHQSLNIDSKPKNVLVFNQEYVDKYLFQEDIINNTFEILINTHEYNVAQNRINDLFNELTVAIASSSLKDPGKTRKLHKDNRF